MVLFVKGYHVMWYTDKNISKEPAASNTLGNFCQDTRRHMPDNRDFLTVLSFVYAFEVIKHGG
jgi:hypothetical protein